MTVQRVRHGLSILEVLIGSVILSLLIGMSMVAFNMLSKQSSHAFESLSQTQDALILLESIRLELASLVMNPFGDPREHEGNSFIISKPNGTSIQFVTERREGGVRKRYLVYYEAKNEGGPSAKPGLTLRKMVWKFTQDGAWTTPIRFPPGWPADWIGKQEEVQDKRWKNLNILDMRWQYLVPDENEGKVFFRVKLTLQGQGQRLLPLTTLVGVATPDLPAQISDCPCLFDPAFDPVKRDCHFCVIQPPEPPPDPNAPPDDGSGG